MKFDFFKVLEGITQAIPILGQAPALIGLFEDVIESFDGDEQQTLKDALVVARADNDEGHARLQQKLADAAKR
jgi:hypothetical protein